MAPIPNTETPNTTRKRMNTRSSTHNETSVETTASVDNNGKKEFTWQEVAKHNTENDMWVTINDKVYDVTQWKDRHPGGIEVLRLVAGRDITVAFDTYHPFTTKAADMLPKFQIGVLKAGSYEFPPYLPSTSGFYQEIKSEVGKYFKENGINHKSPIPGIWRMTLVMIVSLVCFYLAFATTPTKPFPVAEDAETSNTINGIIYSNIASILQQLYTLVAPSLALKLFCAFIFGICQALPLLHVMHDCSHVSFGPSQTWWYIGGRLFLDFYAGCNMTSWHNQHTIGHHIYTNVFKSDPDLPLAETGDVRRLVPKQYWTAICKFQHLYLPVLYGFLGISMRFSDVAEVFTKHTNGPVRVNPHGVWGHMEHIVSKLFCLWWRVYIPLYVWNCDMTHFIVFTTVAEMMTGYWLAFNFQVSHISTVAEFPLCEDGKHSNVSAAGTTNTNTKPYKHEVVPYEWAVAQVLSSVDYSQSSWWTTFCCGALNYQIEHHLLPCVSQYQYPAIAPIVKRVCDKHKVKYNNLPDFYDAFNKHVQYLYQLGQEGKMVPLETSLH